eukprot:TRINITY_DN26064_c0_g1_i1.p2 TRINITY_DN26064_c0_g1~~TRINITY_DN26064_c0_g1_i1.p2  ORF type:complete len:155 (-),score=11.08 TRINITY_DN26064_c0_g1_i1:492-956(-)
MLPFPHPASRTPLRGDEFHAGLQTHAYHASVGKAPRRIGNYESLCPRHFYTKSTSTIGQGSAYSPSRALGHAYSCSLGTAPRPELCPGVAAFHGFGAAGSEGQKGRRGGRPRRAHSEQLPEMRSPTNSGRSPARLPTWPKGIYCRRGPDRRFDM